MTLIRWTPTRNNDLVTFRSEVDRLFDHFFTPAESRPQWNMLTPPVDVEETKEAFHFRADLPGIKPEDVKVTLSGDTLSIRGERKRETEKQEGSLHRVERSYGMFERSFHLDTPVRRDGIEAKYRDGVLEVTVAKAEEAKLREVEVKVG